MFLCHAGSGIHNLKQAIQNERYSGNSLLCLWSSTGPYEAVATCSSNRKAHYSTFTINIAVPEIPERYPKVIHFDIFFRCMQLIRKHKTIINAVCSSHTLEGQAK